MIQCRKIPADNLPDPLYCTRIESMTHASGTYCAFALNHSVKANFRRSFQWIHSTLISIVTMWHNVEGLITSASDGSMWRCGICGTGGIPIIGYIWLALWPPDNQCTTAGSL